MITPWNVDENTGGSGLTSNQIDILVLIERTGAGLSMVAIITIVMSYLLLEKLRTTPNLFLFYAALANMGASVASMIGYDGLNLGKESSLCQAQAFIFQWFMQADPWWSFAMAVNVYLVFFYNVRPSVFRQYAWVYCLVCFGGPLITAVALILIRNDERGLIYGDAVMWCWIDSNWSLVRIYSYYIPVWICILLSIAIYVAVGYHVFHHRNQLRNIGLTSADKGQTAATGTSSDAGDSAEESLSRKPEFYGTAVTEVQITTDPPSSPTTELPVHSPPTISSPQTTSRLRDVTIYDCRDTEVGMVVGSQNFEAVCSSDCRPYPPKNMMSRLRAVQSNAALKLRRLDPVKMAYLRTSFIFAFAVLITWIPSTINRLYSLTHDGSVSFALSVASGCVLPLQGVWNAIIYFTTSWRIMKEEFERLCLKYFSNPDANRRMTMRVESRLGPVAEGRRDTFERL